MKLLHAVSLCLAIAVAQADHHEHHDHEHHDHEHHDHEHHDHEHHDHEHSSAVPDRCLGLEMDAVAMNEEGTPYFFKDGFLFKGFHGLAERANETFAELDEYHHLGHVDAAFLLHFEDEPAEHQNIFFFLDTKVFSYKQHKLAEGYPKNISEVFPGIPDHLDASIACPKPECDEDSVIFFKGDDIFHFNVKTKAVDKKEFQSMPNCTSAFRLLGHYYCFHGHMFSKFDPKTGEVHGKYPKEARDYFMRCSKFSNDSDHVERERCSRVHLDAIAADNEGTLFAFRGHHFLQKFANDTLKADTIESAFPEVHSELDAVFSFQEHLYLVKGKHVFVYKNNALLDGYPKPLTEVLGIEDPIDTAFSCKEQQIVHVIKDNKLYDVDMASSNPAPTNERPIGAFTNIHAAMCGPKGVTVLVGNHFYHYESVMLLVASKMLPEQHRVSQELFGCDH